MNRKRSIPTPSGPTPLSWLRGLAALLFVCTSAAALGQSCPRAGSGSLFNAALCVDGEIARLGFNNLQDLIDAIDNADLKQRFPNYQRDISPGEFRLDVRGLPAIIAYAANSSELVFRVPSLGINETFNGGTRDRSNDQFEDYIKQNGSDILRELLRVSAVDPLAGNPASAQSQMVAGDFDAGFSSMYDSAPPGSAFGMGLRFGSYSMGGFTQNVYTLPLDYTYTFNNHDVLAVRLPLTYIEVDGATAYRGQLGISYKKVITSRWALTPAVGYAVAGSADLGALGQILSASLTSDLNLYDNGRWSLSMGNLLGYYVTIPTRIADFNVDYDIQNTITRNGLLLSIPLQKQFWGREFSIDVFAIGTWFFGDALYNDNYQEYGISIGPRRSADKRAPNLASHPFGIGLKYIHGEGNIDGFELNFGYRF